MKKIIRILLAAVLIALAASSACLPVGAAFRDGQAFRLMDYGFGQRLNAGPFSFWTNTQIPPNGARPLDRFEVLSEPGPVYGMKNDSVIHFSLENGKAVAYCNAGVFDYIVFTAPVDGVYSYKVTAFSWWASGDAEVGFYCNGIWRDPGMILNPSPRTVEGEYTLKRGEQIWFLFRLIYGDNRDPVTIEELTVTLNKITGEQPPAYDLTVSGGKTGDDGKQYCENEMVTVTADPPAEGQTFTGWQAEGIALEDPTANPVSFLMPASPVKLTAQYKEIVNHTVRVENGTLVGGGSEGQYAAGASVTASAPSENEAGEKFSHWEVEGVEIEKTDSRQISFTMPEGDVSLKAVYFSPQTSTSGNSFSGDSGVTSGESGSSNAAGECGHNIPLIILLTALISILLTALVLYLIFDAKLKAAKKE